MGWAAAAMAAGQAAEKFGGMFVGGAIGRKGARQQRRWAEKMANTAYQRGVKDLRKAGLNPMLAYLNPASNPTGAASTSVGSSSGESAVGTGLRAVMQKETLKNVDSDTQLKKALKFESHAREMTNVSQSRLNLSQKQSVDVNTAVQASQIPRAKAEEKFDATAWGQILNQVNRASQSIQGVRGATPNLRRSAPGRPVRRAPQTSGKIRSR